MRLDADDVRYLERSASTDQFDLKAGDLLFTRYNGNLDLVGACARVPDGCDPDLTYPDKLIRVRLDPGAACSSFVEKWMAGETARRQLRSKVKTSAGQAGISGSDLKETPIRLAPLAEQHRIVAKLDAIFERTRAARESLEHIRTTLDESKRVLLERALNRSKGNKRSTQQLSSSIKFDFWDLPPTWQWERIETVGHVQLGRQRAPQYLTGKHSRPYLRVANIKEDRLVLDDIETMDFDAKDFDKYRLLKGDILLSEGQSPELVGESAIYDADIEGLCYQKTLHRFRAAADRTIPAFAQYVFRYYLRSGTFQRFASLTTNIAHLTLEKIKVIPFPLPPLDEQRRIVALLDQQLGIINRTEAAVNSFLTRLKQLEQSALARAFRGELVPQDPADEPASTLLDRIRAERAAAAPAHPARRARKPAAPATPPFALTPSPPPAAPKAKLVARRPK